MQEESSVPMHCLKLLHPVGFSLEDPPESMSNKLGMLQMILVELMRLSFPNGRVFNSEVWM